jgi:CRP-like cAMP-binding protein
MKEDYAEQIARFSLFEGLNSRETQALIELGAIQHMVPGEIAFLEGAAADFVFLILEGELEVFVTRRKGNAVIATQGPGCIVGELAVFCGMPRAASVRAAIPCTILKWQAEAFRQMLLSKPVICERVFRQSVSGLIEKEKSLMESLTRW